MIIIAQCQEMIKLVNNKNVQLISNNSIDEIISNYKLECALF